MNRRHSLKLLSSLPFFALVPSLLKAEVKKATADKADAKTAGRSLLDENDTLAKAMQYKHDATKAPAMRTDKKAICGNCAKFNVCMDGDATCKPLAAEALKTAKQAPCQIFTGKDVSKSGWCLSWQAKA
jgi:hypothetical protein